MAHVGTHAPKLLLLFGAETTELGTMKGHFISFRLGKFPGARIGHLTVGMHKSSRWLKALWQVYMVTDVSNLVLVLVDIEYGVYWGHIGRTCRVLEVNW